MNHTDKKTVTIEEESIRWAKKQLKVIQRYLAEIMVELDEGSDFQKATNIIFIHQVSLHMDVDSKILLEALRIGTLNGQGLIKQCDSSQSFLPKKGFINNGCYFFTEPSEPKESAEMAELAKKVNDLNHLRASDLAKQLAHLVKDLLPY